MTSLCSLYMHAGNLLTGRSAAEPSMSFEMEKSLMTHLEISQMAPRPNHWSCLMAIDVIIVDDYLILLCHLRGIKKSNSQTNGVGVATHLKQRPHHPFAVTDTAFDFLLHKATIWILYFVCIHAHCSTLISLLHTLVRQTRPHLCSMPALA